MKTLITNLVSSNAGVAGLVLRLPTGLILTAHGAQKLFAWFGGYGLEGTGQYMASQGLEPGFLMALLAGSAEFFGGLAIALGLLTRPAAVVTAFTMLVAIFVAHIQHGLFLSNGGFEYALTLFAVTTSLAFSGAGYLAVDNVIARALTANDLSSSLSMAAARDDDSLQGIVEHNR